MPPLSLMGFLAGISRLFFFTLSALILRAGEIPTGGIPIRLGEPASARPRFHTRVGVSRSGEMPEPTVIVRMKEDKTDIAGQARWAGRRMPTLLSAFPCPDSGPCLI